MGVVVIVVMVVVVMIAMTVMTTVIVMSVRLPHPLPSSSPYPDSAHHCKNRWWWQGDGGGCDCGNGGGGDDSNDGDDDSNSDVSTCFPPLLSLPSFHRLVGLVVKASASRAAVRGLNPAYDGIFPCRVIPVTIGTPVATLPGVWRYRVSAETGRPGVSIL